MSKTAKHKFIALQKRQFKTEDRFVPYSDRKYKPISGYEYYYHTSLWLCWKGTPSWWNNLHHTRPTRRQTKRLLRAYREDTIFPNGKKPHVYYW
jgi:hypothetical protein